MCNLTRWALQESKEARTEEGRAAWEEDPYKGQDEQSFQPLWAVSLVLMQQGTSYHLHQGPSPPNPSVTVTVGVIPVLPFTPVILLGKCLFPSRGHFSPTLRPEQTPGYPVGCWEEPSTFTWWANRAHPEPGAGTVRSRHLWSMWRNYYPLWFPVQRNAIPKCIQSHPWADNNSEFFNNVFD